MPAELNVQRNHIPINTRLSDKDKGVCVLISEIPLLS